MLDFTDQFGNKYKLYFRVEKYANNGALAVMAYTDEYEPYATITKNLPESNNLRGNEAYLDTNNVGTLVSAMVNAGYIDIADTAALSGFCVYPLGTFTDKFYAEV